MGSPPPAARATAGTRRRTASLGVRTATAATAAAVLTGAAAAPEAGAAPPPESAGAHCVIEVTGVEADGRMRTAPPRCFATFAEAMGELGLATTGGDVPESVGDLAEVPNASAASAGVIGIHYALSNRQGSSISVSGTDCNGGYVNLSSSWVNRVSSTRNFCPKTIFYDGFDKSGTAEATGLTALNLGALDNRANSIAYGV